MVPKTIFMLLLFFMPLAIIIFMPFTSVLLLFVLYMLNGLGMVGIGTCIMHDAIHGSYSKNKVINKLMGYAIILIGANGEIWRLQHNVLHHSFTNIEAHDDDINAPPFLLRFSPHAKRNKIHRYQHIYVWLLYGLTTFLWITAKDIVKINRYYKMGLVGDKQAYRKGLISIVFWKIVYFSYALVLPIAMTPFSPWLVLAAFLAMHFVMGIIITLIFQVAHITPSASFPLPNEKGKMEATRLEHQMHTTCNFAPESKLLFWLIGGLTNQIEHHLFPTISHVHYRDLAPIVKRTAEEFDLPYHSSDSFATATVSHIKMLRDLGRMELNPIPVSR